MTENSDNPFIGMIMVLGHDNVRSKIKRFLSCIINKGTIISTLIIITLIALYLIISYNNDYLKSISLIIIPPLLTLLLIIFRESYISKDSQRKYIYSFHKEVFRNFKSVLINLSKVNNELEVIKGNQINYKPLHNIQLNMYNLLEQVSPEQLTNIKNIEEYIYHSNEVNEIIKSRDIAIMSQNINILESCKICDKDMKKSLGKLILAMQNILESTLRSVVLDQNEIKELNDTKNYNKFLEIHRLKKESITIDFFKKNYIENNSKVIILILNS